MPQQYEMIRQKCQLSMILFHKERDWFKEELCWSILEGKLVLIHNSDTQRTKSLHNIHFIN